MILSNRVFRIFSFFIIIFSGFIFSSCHTSNIGGAKNNPLDSRKNARSTDKALIFYASDDPILLPYFSSSFTRRISDDGIFIATQNRGLNKEWMANSSGAREEINIEHRIRLYSQNLKNAYFKKNSPKVRYMATTAMKEANSLLSHNPASVGFSYAELSFWSAVINSNIPHVARSFALIYEKYASFALKDALESQVDVKVIEKLKKLTSPYLVKQKTVQILNSSKCAVFVDGQELKSKSIQLPSRMRSVISANCSNGSFSQTFTSDRQKAIKIIPYFPSAFYSMPNPYALPKEQILKEQASAVILIYWSHSEKYMDSIVINPKGFSIVKKTRISLTTRQDLDQAGDNLLAFLKSASANIPKTNSTRLTAEN